MKEKSDENEVNLFLWKKIQQNFNVNGKVYGLARDFIVAHLFLTLLKVMRIIISKENDLFTLNGCLMSSF